MSDEKDRQAEPSEKRKLASMISIRLSPEEDRSVRETAANRNESVSNFIRKAVLAQIRPVAPINQPFTQSVIVGQSLEVGTNGQLVARNNTTELRPI